MAKAILTAKDNSVYDDLIEERYHFPHIYLRQMQQAVGDFIIYYEPRRGGGRGSYFATAKLVNIQPDTNASDHYYAFVSDYLPFDHPVPFKEGGHYYETVLQREDGETNKGAFGRSVRIIPEDEYELILQSGYVKTLGMTAILSSDTTARFPGFAEDEKTTFERPIIERVVARPFRDAAFAAAVKSAYADTCAMTGLKIVNGGGRTEVQAAHIRPVAHAGTDSVRNGLALSGTVHWMFDRGLVSIDDDYNILVAKKH